MQLTTEVVPSIPGGAMAILESITDAFFALDAEWRFTYVNRQAESVLGLPRADLIGRSIWETYPTLPGTEFDVLYRQVVNEQTAATMTAFFSEHRRWYEVHAYPAEVGLSVYFRDATERVTTEQRLRESELRFRVLADSIPQLVWIADAAGRAVFFNQQWHAYTGVQTDAMPAEQIAASFLHPDDQARTIATWHQAVAEERVFSDEHRIRAANGEFRWFLVRAEPYRDVLTGRVVQWFGTSTDVHDTKTTEAALKRTQERYRSLFDSIDEGFCVIEMLFDGDGTPCDYRFAEVNPMFEHQTGLRAAEGRTILEIAPGFETHWFEVYGKVALTGEAIRFESESVALQRSFDVFAFRVDEPEAHRVALLFKDITERNRVQQALRESERQARAERQRLDALLQTVPVGIVVSDVSGAVLLANPAHCQLWGQAQTEPYGMDVTDDWKGWWADGGTRQGQRVAPGDWATSRLLRGEEALNDIVEIESFDRVPVRRTVLISGAPIRSADGAITGSIVAQMDITDRVRAEEALRQADQRKDEFLAMLAHELRNPLAPIAAAADLLEIGRLDEARVRRTSAIISRQVAHMTGLVDDLLDVSRVTRGQVNLNRERLDTKRIVFDAVEQVRPLIESRGHRLAVHTPPESAFVEGDQKRLVQVLSNLLNNAAKYTPEGGDLVLQLEVEGAWVRMSVADNGIGMVPELVSRAFELFTQAERTSDRSQGGLGIGLALVKSLVELHHGNVSAESGGPGCGSRFTVCLPHLQDPAEQQPGDEAGSGNMAAATAAASAGQPGKLKVLVVDDNADAALMLAMLVNTLGHDATVEFGSRKALERAKAERPRVCLLDIGLPDMDGNELARRLRAAPEMADAVLVAVTGYGQEQDRINALAAGFDHHFVKPVDSRTLAALLEAVAAGGRG